MSTNGVTTVEDTEMTDCDGEKVVTMMDVLQEQEEFEEDANAVLGASDDKNCTYSKGYIKRQAIYACLTCCSDAKTDPTKRAGVCLACCLTCHENHELVELYTKRNFRCDCGNPKFNSHPCQFTPNKTELNEENNYNQNFSGVYCTCHRPCPDPESTVEDEMIQCIICEDWYHSMHLEAVVPGSSQYSEMICKACMEKNGFFHDYIHLAVNVENVDVNVLTTNDTNIVVNDIKCNGNVEETFMKEDNEAISKNSICNGVNENKSTNDLDMVEVNKRNDEQENIAITNLEDIDKSEINENLNSKDEELSISPGGNNDKDINTANNDSAMETDHEEKTNDNVHVESHEETKLEEESNINEENITSNETSDNQCNVSSESKCETENTNIQESTLEQTCSVNDKNATAETHASMIIEKNVDSVVSDIENENTCSKENVHIEVLLNDNKNQENKEQTTINSLDGDVSEVNKPGSTDDETDKAEETDIDPSIHASEEHNQNNSEKIKDPVENADIIEKSNDTELDEAKVSQNEETNIITNNINSDAGVLDNNESENITHNINSTSDAEVLENKDESNIPNNIDPLDNKDKATNVTEEINECNETEIKSDNSNSISDTNDSTDLANSVVSNDKPGKDGDCKRKLSTEDISDDSPKKPKLDEVKPCIRPKGVKKVNKGSTFWSSNFRQKLCTCNECISMYNDLRVLFLIDPEDTVTAYENLGKEKINGAAASQYEKGLEALSSLDRIQQINALTEYNRMRDKLLDFLKSFKDRKEIVKEEDIKAFFAGMKPKREPDGVYFCR